jgi:putative transposase
VPSEESAELRKLRADMRERRRANEILKAASAFFAGGARSPAAVNVRFIREHKDWFGAGLICRVLTQHGCQIGPVHLLRRSPPEPSARAVRDDQVKAAIRRVAFSPLAD